MSLTELDEWLSDRGLALFLRAGAGMFWAQLKRIATGETWSATGRSSSEAVLCAQSVFGREGRS